MLREKKPSGAPSTIHRPPSTSSSEWNKNARKRYFDYQVADDVAIDGMNAAAVQDPARQTSIIVPYDLDDLDDLNISIDTMRMVGAGLTPRSSDSIASVE